jgi:transcriptional regulator with XRE-family HTH domain
MMEVTMNQAHRRWQRPAPLPVTELLQRHRLAVQRSQAEIARDAWLDESYVSRLISGERTNPSRDALILLSAFGLRLPVPDVEEILLAADYKGLVLPQSLQ